MPLPVIFKFISDTSGSKFDEVIGEMDNVKISSERASRAVKSLASVFRDSQDPALALSQAVESLTKSLGLGLGATIAGVGIVEIIKSFIKNADEMNKVTESLNNVLENFRNEADTLDLSGAIAQIRILTKELEKASKVGANRPEDRFFGSIADAFFGGAKIKGEVAQQGTSQAVKSARQIAEQSIFEEGRLQILKITNKLEAERVQTADKYSKKLKDIKDAGLGDNVIREISIQKAIELEQIDIKFAEEQRQITQKEADEKTRLAEKEASEKEALAKIDERNHQEMLKQIDAQRKARDDFYRGGFEGSGAILDKIKEAAQRQGRNDIIRRIDKERANLQNATDKILLENLGMQTGEKRFMGLDRRQIENERISGFAQMEANLQREQNNRLFYQVDSVRAITQNILQAINDRLGVPILRSAN
jgi:hypothetical protein